MQEEVNLIVKDLRIKMAECCGDKKPQCDSGSSVEKGLDSGPLEWFGKMIQNC